MIVGKREDGRCRSWEQKAREGKTRESERDVVRNMSAVIASLLRLHLLTWIGFIILTKTMSSTHVYVPHPNSSPFRSGRTLWRHQPRRSLNTL